MILGIVAQFIDVHIRQPADQQFQLGGREDRDQFRRDELVESVQKRLDLRPNAVGHPVVSHQAHILRLVVIGHCHVATTRYQVHHLVTAEVRRFCGECQLQAQHLQRDLQDLFEGLVVVGFDRLGPGVILAHGVI